MLNDGCLPSSSRSAVRRSDQAPPWYTHAACTCARCLPMANSERPTALALNFGCTGSLALGRLHECAVGRKRIVAIRDGLAESGSPGTTFGSMPYRLSPP